MLRVLAALLILLVLLLLALRIAAAVRERGAAMPPGMFLVPTTLGGVAVAMSGPADGPPILLVHGTAAWSGFWKDIAAHLASRGWRVIAVDVPPFGFSDHDRLARYSRVDQARRLGELIGKVAGRPAVLVAHSFGGGAATELALQKPELLRSLVLVDPALGTIDPAAGEGPLAATLRSGLVAETVTAASVTNPLALEPLLRTMIARKEMAAPWLDTLRTPMRRESSTAAYADWLPNLFIANDSARSRRSAELRAIRVPVALIWGEADSVTPLDQGRTLARLMRPRVFTILPGIGHIPHIEDSAAFRAALDAAIAPDKGS